MPSIRATMLGLGLVFTTVLQFTSANPIPTTTEDLADRSEDCEPSKPVRVTPTMPLSGGATELPTTNLTLQYVAIGRGTQNYTCAGAGSAAASDGAQATLFDATTLAWDDESALNAIPPMAVYMNLPTTSLTGFPILGHHYFDAALTPTFDLTSVNKILFAAKTGDIKAPADSNVGPAGTGAVDWLYLKAKPAPYVSNGLQQVYRLVTAGGVAPACTSAGVVTVQYAAEYWFYN